MRFYETSGERALGIINVTSFSKGISNLYHFIVVYQNLERIPNNQ